MPWGASLRLGDLQPRPLRKEANALSPEIESLLAHTPEAAFVADATGRLVTANDAAQSLLSKDGITDPFTALVTAAASDETVQSMVHVVDDPVNKRMFHVTATPLFAAGKQKHPHRVLVTLRDMTLEANLTNTLSESRRRFKELVECSADFAWETDAEGRFVYISKKGAVGFPAAWLEGRSADELLAEPEDGEPRKNPFTCREEISEEELILKDKNGKPAVMITSAVPIFDAEGAWQGTRGVCRDVTLIREHEAALRRAREREQILSSLVTAIRDCSDPDRMLEEAAENTAEALHAPMCIILQMKRGNLTPAYSFDDNATNSLSVLTQYGERQINRLARDPDAPPVLITEMSHQGLLMMGALTRHNRMINGAMCLARPQEAGGWTEDERLLLEGVSDHVGIVLAQINAHEKVKRLSRTDELTGLLNRRGFQDHVEPRIPALQRSRQYAALIYLDLDYFKQVNDRYGHDRGDLVLKTLGIYLDGHIRGNDYCARIGGDEFAVWLDNTTKEGAIRKAERFLELRGELQEVAGWTDPPLSMSLGIVLTDPRVANDLNELFDRADQAMYEAKKNGKNSFVVAEPVEIQKTG